ncbi:MAG: hypothetical protein HY035_07955 [Nitrospirae bacterium]|nr:hypothetical protein [Nitrospirota bacterium]MBI3378315.1 hypothetical protein [Nitrospirota bacterium]
MFLISSNPTSGFNSDCSPLSASFKYDALGRRIEKTVNGRTINYLYDGLDIVQEIESGTVTVNYIRTLNIDEPLVRIKSDGTVRYYQQDALGSVIALTDESGTIKTTYSYDPFGNVTVSGEASDNPFQFAGRENDGTGLLFERNRYDSLELQRYISQDPIGLAGGDVNFYVRVWNDPVNWVDPEGLKGSGGKGKGIIDGIGNLPGFNMGAEPGQVYGTKHVCAAWECKDKCGKISYAYSDAVLHSPDTVCRCVRYYDTGELIKY